MQPATAPPRDALTSTQITDLIEASTLTVEAGCEVVNAAETEVDDVSDVLQAEGSVVERGNYRNIHGLTRLRFTEQLEWGSERVRPFMTLSAGGVSARFDLGTYLLTIPHEPIGESPATFEVEGFDKGLLLDQPIGETYYIQAGSGYTFWVEEVLRAAGVPVAQQVIDQSAIAKVLPQDRTWLMSEENTYRRVLADLCDAINYRAVWFDWAGRARVEPYESPANRAEEWTYDAQSASTILGEVRDEHADYTDAPNKWVFAVNDPLETFPVEGDGLYIVENQSDGPTSIDARGRTIMARPVPITIDAADHDSLVARAAQQVDRDKRLYRDFRFSTGPNPLHWHFDVCRLVDSDTGLDMKLAWRSWVLPLDGSDQTHEARQA